MDYRSAQEFRQYILSRPNDGKPPASPPPLPTRSDLKEKLFLLSNMAIESYNSKHQNNQFEVVDPLHITSYRLKRHHLSFIARRKRDSDLKFFFAEVSYADTVDKCIIVEPGNPLFVIGCGICHPDGVIYHPYQYTQWYGWDPYQVRPRPPPLDFESPEHSAKRFLSEAYTMESRIEELNTDDVDELKRTISVYAVEATRVYNFDHDASFKPLEIVASVRFGFVHELIGEKLWVHFIFKATNKDHALTNASPEYFFAELGLLTGTVTTCVMIDNYSGSTYSEIGCAVCRQHCPMFHPESGMKYRIGRDGGDFCDALHENGSRAVKAKLELKDGDSSNAVRSEYWKI